MKRGAAAVVLLCWLWCGGSAFAVECSQDTRPIAQREKELPTNAAVLAGRATSVRMVERWVQEADFSVSRAWRGVRSPTVRVRSNIYMLGPVFKEGEEYLVFAYPGSGPGWLQAAMCSDTAKIADAGPWLSVLGTPTYDAGGKRHQRRRPTRRGELPNRTLDASARPVTGRARQKARPAPGRSSRQRGRSADKTNEGT